MIEWHQIKLGARVKNIGTDEYGAIQHAGGKCRQTFCVHYDGSGAVVEYHDQERKLFILTQQPKLEGKRVDVVILDDVIPKDPLSHARIASPLPHDSAERKLIPLYSGLMAYFPAALTAVAKHSLACNKKHNPNSEGPPQWARGKSGDHADAVMRHLMEGDYEGLAWRALAILQETLEKEGAPLAPAAHFNKDS